jgi:hypothetical protein
MVGANLRYRSIGRGGHLAPEGLQDLVAQPHRIALAPLGKLDGLGRDPIELDHGLDYSF